MADSSIELVGDCSEVETEARFQGAVVTHDACQPTEDENLEKGRDLEIPYEAHQNDIADLAVCHQMTLAEE